MIILREKSYIEPIKRPISKLLNSIDATKIRFSNFMGNPIKGDLVKRAPAVKRLDNIKSSKQREYFIRN